MLPVWIVSCRNVRVGRILGELPASSHLAALIDDNFLRGLTRPGAQALNLKIRKQIDKRNGTSQQKNFQCCGSRMFLPDPNFFHPRSQIRIKDFKYFNPKNCKIWSGLFIPDPDFYPSRIRIFSHPGSRIQGSKRHRIPNPDPQHWKLFKKISVIIITGTCFITSIPSTMEPNTTCFPSSHSVCQI